MTVKLTKKQIQIFQEKILEWYKLHQRTLPWRQDRDPYHILVSEMMSQQTQISRVVSKYLEWMKAFPTIQALAKASTRDVLFHWSGLGYNRRALYLKKCAEEIVRNSEKVSFLRKQESRTGSRIPFDELRVIDKSGMTRRNNSRHRSNNNITWPETEEELMKLPGIGKYTARAILCFASNKQVAVVDTNVRKVILTHFFGSQLSVVGSQNKGLSVVSKSVLKQINRKQANQVLKTENREQITEKEIGKIAELLLPKGHAYEWNQALMDYAAAELKQHKIPIPRQSKFKDSDRYYRGLILRLLLKYKHMTFKKLEKMVDETQSIGEKRLKKIVDQLTNDCLVIERKESFRLPD